MLQQTIFIDFRAVAALKKSRRMAVLDIYGLQWDAAAVGCYSHAHTIEIVELFFFRT